MTPQDHLIVFNPLFTWAAIIGVVGLAAQLGTVAMVLTLHRLGLRDLRRIEDKLDLTKAHAQDASAVSRSTDAKADQLIDATPVAIVVPALRD